MNFGRVISLARYTFIGNLRSRIFLVLILFGVMLLSASFLLSILAQEQEIRILTDLGLASIEVLSLFTAIFLIVNLVLEQIEQKTIYLLLTRSLTRAEYLAGSYAGTLFAVFLGVFFMTALNVLVLMFKGWNIHEEGLIYFAQVFMSFEKIILISAIGLFFSLFSSSGVVALVFTFFIWTSGHFVQELRFLSDKITTLPIKWTFKFFYFIIPHFQYLNARDIDIVFKGHFVRFAAEGFLYTVSYSFAALLLAYASFRKKEF